MKLYSNCDTFLKKFPIASGDLEKLEKIWMPCGKLFAALSITPDKNQHVKIRLASPIQGLTDVYGYAPHLEWDTKKDESQIIKLMVPYFSQLNNDTNLFGQGWRQCNLTSTAMLLDFLLKGELSKKAKVNGYSEPESLYAVTLDKYGDTTDHNAHTKALKDFGIESYFSYTLSFTDLVNSLKVGIPVVIGCAYKLSGHMVVCVGHDPIKEQWLIHDPYGTRLGSSDSYDIGVGGAFDEYSNDTMQKVWLDQGNEAGWGRIVTSVRGKSTELPTGL